MIQKLETIEQIPVINKKTYLGIVVHTAGAGRAYTAEVLDKDHFDRWKSEAKNNGRELPDEQNKGCGYNFVIAPDGTLYFNPRRWGSNGAHASQLYKRGGSNYPCNSAMIGICFLGDGDKERASEAQIATYEKLKSKLFELFTIQDGSWVISHHEVKPEKSCPGVKIREQLGLK